MIDSEIVYNVYTFDQYLITYDSSIRAELFYCEWYYGITFYINDSKYELIHNYALGNRILINLHEGWFQDIPFKPATFDFLPPGIQAKEI